MEATVKLIKLKPGSEGTVKQWVQTMAERKVDAVETLREDEIAIESWFSISINEEPYLLCYSRGNALDDPGSKLAQSRHSIDWVKEQFMNEAWLSDEGITGRLLVDLAP